MLNIVSYNCNSIRHNIRYVQKLSDNHDIVFLQECWLTSRKEFVELVGKNSRLKMYYKPNDENYSGQGRHSGGIGWIVNKRVGKTSVEFINNRISLLKVRDTTFIGVYLTSNSNKPDCHVDYRLELNLLRRIKKKLEMANQKVVMLGDFNGDVLRNNNHDKYFNEFLKEENLLCYDKITNNSYTWYNVNDKSHVDHIVSTEGVKINETKILYNDIPNDSDHWAISFNIECNQPEKTNDENKLNKIVWDDYTKMRYERILKEKLSKYYYFINESIFKNSQLLSNKIEKIIYKLNFILQETANEISEYGKIRAHKRNKKWWSTCLDTLFKELQRAKKKYRENKTMENKLERNKAKNAFQYQQRKSINDLKTKSYMDMNVNFRKDKTKFYKEVKRMKDELVSTEIESIHLKNEMSKLFNERLIYNKEMEDQAEKEVSEFMTKYKDVKFNYEISSSRLVKIIGKIKLNKASGQAKTKGEYIKYGCCPELIKLLKYIYETIINYDIKVKNFNIGLIKPIVKDTNKNWDDISNLRPITISDIISTIYEKIILEEIEINHPNIDKQFGFKKSSSCSHAVFILREILAYNKRLRKNTLICAIDASKAFDKVCRSILWSLLIGKIEPPLVRSLINYYDVSKAIAMVGVCQSSVFKTTVGVKQGGPLSPRLFSLYTEKLGHILDNTKIGIKIGELIINNLFYADDILLIASTKDEMNKLLKLTEEFGKNSEIKFNPDKTNYVVISANKTIDPELKSIRFGSHVVECTNSLKYLGVFIESNYLSDEHVQSRISAAWNNYKDLINCGIEADATSTEVKMYYYYSYIRSSLYYGIDTAKINKDLLLKIHRTETNIIKSMFGLSKHASTEPIRKALHLESTNNEVTKLKIKFILRSTNNELVYRLIDELLKNDERVLKDQFSLIGEINKLINNNLETNDINIFLNDIEDRLYEEVELVMTEKTIKTSEILTKIGRVRRKELNELLLHEKAKIHIRNRLISE